MTTTLPMHGHAAQILLRGSSATGAPPAKTNWDDTISVSPEAHKQPPVLLVSGDVLTRVVLARTLDEAGMRAIPVAHPTEALNVLETVPGIRVVVTDALFRSSDLSGVQLARHIAQRWTAQVVVTASQSLDPSELPTGACFLAKPVHGATLIHLVRDLMGAEAPLPVTSTRPVVPQPPAAPPARRAPDLTPRQKEVLGLLMEGRSTDAIAEALGLSVRTVRVHLVAMFKTLGVSSRVQAVLVGQSRLQAASRLSQRSAG